MKLTGTTTTSQSGPGSNDNEGVTLHPLCSRRSLASYLRHSKSVYIQRYTNQMVDFEIVFYDPY